MLTHRQAGAQERAKFHMITRMRGMTDFYLFCASAKGADFCHQLCPHARTDGIFNLWVRLTKGTTSSLRHLLSITCLRSTHTLQSSASFRACTITTKSYILLERNPVDSDLSMKKRSIVEMLGNGIPCLPPHNAYASAGRRSRTCNIS
jgi:hypothetical protein